jgi:hypothetical protein
MARASMIEQASGSEIAPSDKSEKPKVVYVLGAHRSGSTILGVTLGNCEEIFFAGEVHSWLTRRGIPSFCDERGEELWRAVRARMKGAAELFGDETQLYLDRSSALYRVNRWPARRRLRGGYRRINEELYRAIAAETDARHIVDSSHYPLRALELQRMQGIDLYLLFLVRDPQGIVASLDPNDPSSGSKSPLTTNLHLWATYLLSLRVFWRQPRDRRLFVRHEQFIADPQLALRQILDFIGSPAPLPDLMALDTGSPLQGNRFLRDSGVIALRSKAERPARSSLMTTILQLPWAPVLALLRPALRKRSSPERESAAQRP